MGKTPVAVGMLLLLGVAALAATWSMLDYSQAPGSTGSTQAMEEDKKEEEEQVRVHHAPSPSPMPPILSEADMYTVTIRDLPDQDETLKAQPVLIYHHGFKYKQCWSDDDVPAEEGSVRVQPSCSTPCAVTRDKRMLAEADAVLISGPDARRDNLPEMRTQWRRGGVLQQMQPWILQSWEAASYYPLMADGRFVSGLFNFTERVGDKEGADYIASHQYLLSRDLLPLVPLADRIGKVFALYSNCEPKNNRNTLLQRLIDLMGPAGWLHSYGKCHTNQQWPARFLPPGTATHEQTGDNKAYMTVKSSLQRHYKFELVIQNANCRGFVDEKVFHAWLHGVVPIYHGAPDIDKYAPRGPNGEPSYILLSQFPTPEKLALHLQSLDADDDAYMKYHSWRDHPVYQDEDRLPPLQRMYPDPGKGMLERGHPICFFCGKVRDAQLHPTRTYTAQADHGCCDQTPGCVPFSYPPHGTYGAEYVQLPTQTPLPN